MALNYEIECLMQEISNQDLLESSSNMDGLRFLLDKMKFDPYLDDYRHASYMLATVKHETGHTFMPVSEIGGSKRSYAPYYGRGYVQITHQSNYKRFGGYIGLDLVGEPDYAKDPETAYMIMSIGLLLDSKQSFTGKTLWNYIYGDECDYYNARKCINGLDKAQKIKEYATKFDLAFQGCLGGQKPSEKRGGSQNQEEGEIIMRGAFK